jgi:hypothetical protein
VRPVLLAALVLAACGSPVALPSAGVPSLELTPSPGPVSHTCQASELKPDAPPPVTSGGTQGILITLENVEAGTCGLYGYPSLSHGASTVAVSNGGGRIFGNQSAFHVLLRPGDKAYVGVEWQASATTCATGTSLALTFAGEHQPLAVPLTAPLCGPVVVTPALGSPPITAGGAPSGTPAATSTP